MKITTDSNKPSSLTFQHVKSHSCSPSTRGNSIRKRDCISRAFVLLDGMQSACMRIRERGFGHGQPAGLCIDTVSERYPVRLVGPTLSVLVKIVKST